MRSIALLVLGSFLAAGASPAKSTHTYKTVDGLEIQADVYRAAGEQPSPAIFWIHGGALIFGHKGNIQPRQLQRYLDEGFTVVSIDYRLAPETKLPAIAEDVCDAWKWVNDNASRFGIDSRRIALVGHSAGGYLSLLSGATCAKTAKAVVSFYGYGDISAEWYAKPSVEYSKQKLVPESVARATVGTTPISGTTMKHERWNYYTFLRQRGLWVNEVAGFAPDSAAAMNQFSPIRLLTKSFPATMLLHGDVDTDVPVEQSRRMAAELKTLGVTSELVVVPNGPHVFDGNLNDETARGAFDKAIAFLKQQLH
jgi:acetyl esterase/lipase